MIALRTIKQVSKILYYAYRGRIINKKIDLQKDAASYIYDSITSKKPLAEIEKNLCIKISKEVKSILHAIKKIGYLTIPPLQNSPTVTVVIPHFNHSQYLDKTLLYLTKQTKLPEEVLVIDDYSDDIEKVKKISKKYNPTLNLKLITSNKKLFTGGCRQLGAELATSDLIVMHDADDISHENRIEFTKYFFKKYPMALHLNMGLVRFSNRFFPHVKKFDICNLEKNIITTNEIIDTMRHIFVNQLFSIIDQPPIRWGRYGHQGHYSWECHGGHISYRKEVANLIKWTTPKNHLFTQFEDYEFNFLLLLAGQQSFQIDLPLIYYRQNSTTNCLI